MCLLIYTLHHSAICTLPNCSKFSAWLQNSTFTFFKMTFCNLLCQPAKRMLIFVTADQTKAILETTKVRKILQGDRVQEGATVLVNFDQCWESWEYPRMADFIMSKAETCFAVALERVPINEKRKANAIWNELECIWNAIGMHLWTRLELVLAMFWLCFLSSTVIPLKIKTP